MTNQFDISKCSQFVISECLNHLKSRFATKYNLNKYTSHHTSTLFFGLFNIHEIQQLQIHKGPKYVMFAGTDLELIKTNSKLLTKLSKISVDGYIGISLNIIERMKLIPEINLIKMYYFPLNLVDNNLFKSIDLENNGKKNGKKKVKKIFIYNGLSIGNEHIYNKELYEQIVNNYPQIEFIYSCGLSKSYEQMPQIYSECFIGLRLTKNDGNANMVQEMVSMGIPVIHNGEQGGIGWTNLDDIIKIINKFI